MIVSTVTTFSYGNIVDIQGCVRVSLHSGYRMINQCYFVECLVLSK